MIKSLVDGRLYKGMTEDVEKRVQSHNAGKVQSTKGFRPWKLIYQEAHPTRQKARARELYFKTGSGREFLKSIDS